MIALLSALLAVGLVKVILALAIVGFLCWLILTYIPMPAVFKNVLVVVIVIVLILWLLREFGFEDFDL